MTLYDSITKNRRFDSDTRCLMASNEDWLRNLELIFRQERKNAM